MTTTTHTHSVCLSVCYLSVFAGLGEVVQSGRLSVSSLYRSRREVNDITAAPGGGAYRQPSSCGPGARGAAVVVARPLDPGRLPAAVPGRSRSAVRHRPVSSSGTKRQRIV